MDDTTKDWKTRLAEEATDAEKAILLNRTDLRSSIYRMSGSSSNPSGFVKLNLNTKELKRVVCSNIALPDFMEYDLAQEFYGLINALEGNKWPSIQKVQIESLQYWHDSPNSFLQIKLVGMEYNYANKTERLRAASIEACLKSFIRDNLIIEDKGLYSLKVKFICTHWNMEQDYKAYESEAATTDLLKSAAKIAEAHGASKEDITSLKLHSEANSLYEVFNPIINGVQRKPDTTDKQNKLDIDARKAPTIQVNKGSHQASITRKALSEAELNEGSNRKNDPHFDKRINNANKALNDIYGLRTKLDAPGCIKLYEANGNQGYKKPVTIDCFLLQSVQMALKEKYSVFQSLSGDVLAYFFGKNPVSCRFSAVLYNTYNQEWFHDFKNYYDKYLRGSASIGKNIRTVISYENHIMEGFFLEMMVQESATNTNIINIDFTMLVVQDHVIDYTSPEPMTSEATGEAVTETSAATDARFALVPDGTSVAQPDNSVISVTAKKGATLVSDSQDSKTIAPGETIKVVDPPRSDDKGENYYAVEAGSYNDAEGNPQAVNSSYRIKADDVIKEETGEDPMNDKKIINLSKPEVANTQLKSDINPKSRPGGIFGKIVKTADSIVMGVLNNVNKLAK